MKNRLRLAALGAACAGVLYAPGTASAADAIYGLTEDNRIVRFNSDAPGHVLQTVPVQGLQPGETLVGLDVRPVGDALYALGTSNRLYRVNPVTGATSTAFGDPFAPPALNGTSFGVDFNPVADALRIVSEADQNLRVPFGGENPGKAREDEALKYADGQNPAVGGAAYTNSVPGANETTLYDIDTERNVLVRQDPPNTGLLTVVGDLGVDAELPAGFDISPQGNVAYAALRVPGEGRHSLYRIDLATGRATPAAEKAEIGSDTVLRGIAVATGGVDDDRTRPEISVAFSSTILEQNTDVLKPSVSCNEACTITASVRVEGRAAGSGEAELDRAGRASVEMPLNVTAQRRIERRGTERLSLSVRVVDAAGNVSEQTGRLSRTQTLAGRIGGG